MGEAGYVFGVVLKIGIHLKDIVRRQVFKDVFESAGVRLPKPFFWSGQKVEIVVFFLEFLHDVGSVVR